MKDNMIEVHYDLIEEPNKIGGTFHLLVPPRVGEVIRDRRKGDVLYEVVRVWHVIDDQSTRIVIAIKQIKWK